MHAPAIAPWEEGCKDLKKRLSPPVKCSQGTIIASMDIALLSDVLMGIDEDIDIDTAGTRRRGQGVHSACAEIASRVGGCRASNKAKHTEFGSQSRACGLSLQD